MIRSQLAVLALFLAPGVGRNAIAQELVVDAVPSHVVNTFSPVRALGTSVDRMPSKAADRTLRPPLLDTLLDSGWQAVSYRQNTELEAEAWHWNPKGTWSDPSGKGYFVGEATPGAELIEHSWGYALPHRGTTMDSEEQGFHYSRATDGDTATYWKSNPYLTRRFTGEDDALLPQWIILDLGGLRNVNAMRIAWGEPYASRYRVQFWTAGENSPRRYATHGTWQSFQKGIISGGQGGTVTLELTSVPVTVRYVRIWMTASSNTCDSHGGSDVRNCAGYAIRELYAGTVSQDGVFTDLVQHSAGRGQSSTVCSSVDPWHAPADINEKGTEQVGLDRFYLSGVTRGLAAMVPVAMIYSTPEDAAAQIAYLQRRHYPISYIELGEEPDGQQMQPEDYAALYLQFAAAIHKVDPQLRLGGPSFEGANEDIEVWPTADGRASWLGRFIDYLKDHNRLSDLAFMSFEHYPANCRSSWSDLYREPERIAHIMDVWRNDGVPAGVPLMMTEGNLSAGQGGMSLDIMGALWLADFEGAFLTAGGAASYHYHLIPEPLRGGCDAGGGTFGFVNVDAEYALKGYFSQYFATQLITREWVQPVDQAHRLFRVASDVRNGDGVTLVTAYAVLRPDGEWSLLVVNKDRDQAHTVSIRFRGDSGRESDRSFFGPLAVSVFGAAQYQWHAAGAASYADPDRSPLKSTLQAGARTVYELPRASIMVIRGNLH
jgi:hypothetical protein